jgi:glutathione S-transferase
MAKEPPALRLNVYGTVTSPFVRRVRVVARELKVPYTLVDTTTDEGQTALRARSPIWKVPTVELFVGEPKPRVLWDSALIVGELIARKGAGLLRLPDERKPFTEHIDEVAFMTAVDEALLALVKRFYLQRDGASVDGVASLDKDRERVDSILAWLETQIDKGSWRARGGFGRAELWVVTALDWMRFREVHPLDKYPKLVALLEQANGRPTLHATRPGQAEA